MSENSNDDKTPTTKRGFCLNKLEQASRICLNFATSFWKIGFIILVVVGLFIGYTIFSKTANTVSGAKDTFCEYFILCDSEAESARKAEKAAARAAEEAAEAAAKQEELARAAAEGTEAKDEQPGRIKRAWRWVTSPFGGDDTPAEAGSQ